MRRIVLVTAATLTLLVAGSFASNRAEAMTVTTPSGLAAVDGTNLAPGRRLSSAAAVGGADLWLRLAPRCWWTGDGGTYYYGGGPYYGRRYYQPRYWW